MHEFCRRFQSVDVFIAEEPAEAERISLKTSQTNLNICWRTHFKERKADIFVEIWGKLVSEVHVD